MPANEYRPAIVSDRTNRFGHPAHTTNRSPETHRSVPALQRRCWSRCHQRESASPRTAPRILIPTARPDGCGDQTVRTAYWGSGRSGGAGGGPQDDRVRVEPGGAEQAPAGRRPTISAGRWPAAPLFRSL